jgi:hypothetical protein
MEVMIPPIPQDELLDEDELPILHVDEKNIYTVTSRIFDLVEKIFGLECAYEPSDEPKPPKKPVKRRGVLYIDRDKRYSMILVYSYKPLRILLDGIELYFETICVERNIILLDRNCRESIIDSWQFFKYYNKLRFLDEILMRYFEAVGEREKKTHLYIM